MSEIKLAATARTEFGKGAARRIRRADQIPAVIYGHGASPLHITLPGHATMLALKHSNALLTIELDGGEAKLAVAKDVQRDPVRNVIEHVDLLEVKRGEKIQVDVAIHVVGESAPGTIHVVEQQTITVEAEATSLPESVEVSVEGVEAGQSVRAGDLTLPGGAVLVGDPEDVLVTIELPKVSAEDQAAEGEPTEGEAGAQGDEG